jgi:DNA-binding transcriptional ArsR family regulator
MATAILELTEISDNAADAARCCPPVEIDGTIGEREAAEYAGWFKALSDPTRIQILNLLARSPEPLCVCDIVDRFPLVQSAISHHLKILKEVRFVVAERRGTFMYYRLNRACLAEFPAAARRILHAG